jgi:elongation factor 1-alpha
MEICDGIKNLKIKSTETIKPENIKPEIRIGVLGNVDSGKSSTIGVITKNILDDGKGYARSLVMKHPHEKETGRTSDVSQLYIQNEGCVIDFIDLAGHEKYLKTTMHGISGYLIDYALIVINANTGIQKMTREHLGLVLSMKIPIIVIYTKIDIAPKNVIKENLNCIDEFFKKRTKTKRINVITDNTFEEKTSEILDNYHKNIFSSVPLFSISNVSGSGVDNMKKFIHSLPELNDYNDRYDKSTNFIIDRKYIVSGIGLVISGVLKYGTIKKGDVLYLGPIDNKYIKVIIRSIHNNFRENIDQLYAGQGGCLNIKTVNTKDIVKRKTIRKGARLVSQCATYKRFTSKVKILHHPTTITKKYQPTIHCGPVSQCARIIDMNKEYLRSHDEAEITFEFMYRPEIIEKGCNFVFREGLTKGIGVIDEIIPYVKV